MKNLLNHILSFAISFSLIVGVVSCGGSKGAANAQTRLESNSHKTLNEQFVDLAESYQGWSQVKMPIKIALKSPKRISVSGNLTMVNKAYLNISVRILGMELALLHIDNENLYIVDRLNHEYVETSISVFEEAAGLSLSDIQSLLLGQAFVPGNGTITVKERNQFSFEATGIDTWTISPKKKIDGVDWHFSVISPEYGSPLVESLVILPANYSPLTASFSGHNVTPAGSTAETISVDGKMHKNDINLSITLNSSKASWNSSADVSGFKVPDGYKRVPVANVIAMLKHL